MKGYDPVKTHLEVEKKVYRNDGSKRKYFRFRASRIWYGGIVTGDVVGCGLNCVFCWVSPRIRFHVDEVGFWCSPEEAFSKMKQLVEKTGINKVRLSGGEPTIGRKHLLKLIELFDEYGAFFILETNGILIGHDPSYAEELSKFSNLHVRVSIKGCTPEMFSKLTGADPIGFELQLKALENLIDHGVSTHAAAMVGFCTEDEIAQLVDRLESIKSGLGKSLELEYLILYPHVERAIKKLGLKYTFAVRP